jgi:hypothetical protein
MTLRSSVARGSDTTTGLSLLPVIRPSRMGGTRLRSLAESYLEGEAALS